MLPLPHHPIALSPMGFVYAGATLVVLLGLSFRISAIGP